MPPLHSTESNFLRSGGSEGRRKEEGGRRTKEKELAQPSSPFPLPSSLSKESDKWYTPPNIEDLVTHVLGAIDLDPCADDGKHIKASHHYTAIDDGLSQEWHGRVFMNPPYSCPGKWVAKLQAEYESGSVSEAIALVPASTDTNWLSPLLESQPVCFWKGRIKFLDTNYQPKLSARQSHCFVYWGENWQWFKEIFEPYGVVKMPDAFRTTSNNNKEEHKIMTDTAFQFSATQQIAQQIAQLQEQLNQLAATLKPYQECEQKAEELCSQVAEYGHEMTSEGIPQQDILRWGKSLYSAASGAEFVEGDVGVIAAQNEVISKLKSELVIAQKQATQTIKELSQQKEITEVLRTENLVITAKNKHLEELTDSLDAQLSEQQLMPITEALKQEIEELKVTNSELRSALEFEKKPADRVIMERLDDLSISEQIIDILKVTPKLSGNQIIESLGMDKEERGIYTHLNRLVGRGVIFCDADPLDGRRKLYSLHLENNTQHDTQHLENNTQHDTFKGVSFSKGDRACVVDIDEDENLRYLLGNSGIVLSVEDNSATVLFDRKNGIEEHEVVLRSRYLNYVEPTPAPHPDIEAQIKGREFIASIKTKAGANNITWTNVSEVCQSNPVVLTNMCLSANTKLQKEFVSIDNLARLMADYISETGDITDFGWLDKTFVAKVEALMEVKKSLPYHQGDWVRVKETSIVCEVRSFDGEWLSALADGKITSLHKSEVELMQLEIATQCGLGGFPHEQLRQEAA